MVRNNKVETRNLVRASKYALEYLNRFNRKKLQIPRSFFLMLHKILLADKPKDAGRYRTAVDILKIPKSTFKPAEAWEIEHKILELIDFINNKHKWGPKFRKYILNKMSLTSLDRKSKTILYRVFISWYIHHLFVCIHPFKDGNGRMARFLMCLILRYEGLSYMSVPALVNTVINSNKEKYLNNLNNSDKELYYLNMPYVLDVLESSYKITKNVVNKMAKK